MKNRKIVTCFIIINVIIVIIYALINKKVNIIKENKIIKEMNTSEYDTLIKELNKSHEDYAIQVQGNKKKLAQAISNEKVATSENATVDEMVTNIGRILQARTSDATATADDIAKGKTAWVNGELINGNNNITYVKYVDLEFLNIGGLGKTQDINVDLTDIPNYENITLDNISTIKTLGHFLDSNGNLMSINISLQSYSNGKLIIRGTSFWSTYGEYALNVPIIITF